MGNALSEEEQEQIMEEAYNLEDSGADRQLNNGTSAPKCQPAETTTSHKNQRTSSTMSVREAQEERRKRQNLGNASSSSSLSSQQEQEMTAAAQQKKLSYFQMAKLGYQELVNAIIRPPRADYKVCSHCRLLYFLPFLYIKKRRSICF